MSLALALVLGSLLLGQQLVPRQVHLGASAQGRPIDGYWLGNGRLPIVIIGGIHGGPEINTSELVWQMLDYFAVAGVPPRTSLLFVPEANPDGIANATRELADGVDANRNFPTADWSPETYGPGKQLPDGGGGWPLSEPETIALAQLIERTHPAAILSYHSAEGIAMGGPVAQASGLLAAYTEASGYPAAQFVASPVTGDFAQWCDEAGIPTVEVELTSRLDPELDRNVLGVEAVLERISSRAPDQSY